MTCLNACLEVQNILVSYIDWPCMLWRQPLIYSIPQCIHKGFTPYFLGDKGYLLYTWLFTLYQELLQRGIRSIEGTFFNQKLKTKRCVVKNAFEILKRMFKELNHVTQLHVMIVPKMIVACCLPHDLLLSQSPIEVARLLEIIYCKGVVFEVDDNPEHKPHPIGPSTMEF